MTDMRCGYAGDRDEALIAYLYDDIDPAARAAFDAHLAGCEPCRAELDALGGVRTQLARWNPPEPKSLTAAHTNPQSAIRNPQWWRTIPAWAQVAAALLFLGVSAGIANLDVRYDSNGFAMRTGWSKPPQSAPASAAAGPGEGVGAASTAGAGSRPVSRAELVAAWLAAGKVRLERDARRRIDVVVEIGDQRIVAIAGVSTSHVSHSRYLFRTGPFGTVVFFASSRRSTVSP